MDESKIQEASQKIAKFVASNAATLIYVREMENPLNRNLLETEQRYVQYLTEHITVILGEIFA